MLDNTKELNGVFKNGYGYIPKSVMKNKNISIKAKALYAYLCSYAGKDNIAFPSRKLMCYDLQISQDSLNKYIKELIENGLICKSCRRKEGNRFDNNIYTINFDLELNEPIPKNTITENTSKPLPNSSVMENQSNDKTSNGELATNNNNNTNNINNNINNDNKKREDTHSTEYFKNLTKTYIDNIKIIDLIDSFIDLRESCNKSFKDEKQFSHFIDSLRSIDNTQGIIDCLEYSLRNKYADIYPERFREKDDYKESENNLSKEDYDYKQRHTITRKDVQKYLKDVQIFEE